MDETGHAALLRVGRTAEEFLRLAQVSVDSGIPEGGFKTRAEEGPGAGFGVGRVDGRTLITAAQQEVPIGSIRVRAGIPDRKRIARKRAGAGETIDARSRDVRIAGAAQRDRTQADAELTACLFQQVRQDPVQPATVDTLEIDPKMYEEALKNIEDAGLSERVHCYLCDAAQFETKKKYDLIFIDAAKSQYRRYLEHFLKNSEPHTVFIFDNLAFHGIVDDESLSENRSTIQMVHKIRKFRDALLSDERFITEYYPDTGDGIAVARIR